VRERNPLAQYLRNVDVGKRRHHCCHHEGDGEHDLGFSAHSLVVASRECRHAKTMAGQGEQVNVPSPERFGSF
jgi:hypothetical protein